MKLRAIAMALTLAACGSLGAYVDPKLTGPDEDTLSDMDNV